MSAFDRLSRMCGPQVPPELLAELAAHRDEVLNEAADAIDRSRYATGNEAVENAGKCAAVRLLLEMADTASAPVPVQSAGDETGEADVDTVAARAAAAISAMGADLRAARKERDRYRNAWQNARTRAADGWADAAKAEADVAKLRDLERRVTEQLEDFEEGLEEDPGAPAVARNMTALLARAVRGDR